MHCCVKCGSNCRLGSFPVIAWSDKDWNRIKVLKCSQAALIKRRDELTEELNQSIFERLRLEEVKAKEEGRDLLSEMAAELENRVIELQAQLDQLGVTDLDISDFNQPQS